MSLSGRRLAILAVTLPVALLILALETGAMDLCGPSKAAVTPGAEAPALCYAEFWLNRYQTLIAAVVALGAAVYAGLPAWRQLRATEQQLAALMGDLPPDMWVDWEIEAGSGPGQLENAVLTIVNRNRRALRVRCVRLLKPRGVPFSLYEWKPPHIPKKDPLRDESLDGATWDGDYLVPGRDEGGAGPRAASLLAMFGDHADEGKAGADEMVRFQVEFDLLGSTIQRHKTEVSGEVRRRAR
jgi:hypothetical protein